MPSKQGSPTVRRLRLGQELRLLRERRQLTGAKVANELGWSPSKISRIEAAKTMPVAEDIQAMGTLYRIDSAKLDELFGLLRDADQRGWWEDYEDTLPGEYTRFLGLEAEATFQRNWEPQVVSGLLQTEDYARRSSLRPAASPGSPTAASVAVSRHASIGSDVSCTEPIRLG